MRKRTVRRRRKRRGKRSGSREEEGEEGNSGDNSSDDDSSDGDSSGDDQPIGKGKLPASSRLVDSSDEDGAHLSPHQPPQAAEELDCGELRAEMACVVMAGVERCQSAKDKRWCHVKINVYVQRQKMSIHSYEFTVISVCILHTNSLQITVGGVSYGFKAVERRSPNRLHRNCTLYSL